MSNSSPSFSFSFGTGVTKQEEPAFWKGPYGVLVDKDINSIVAADGHNIMTRTPSSHFSTTMAYATNPPSKEEWLAKYAREEDGKWYYNVQPRK